MAFKHRSRSIKAFIPTASMADIAFLLIIFFMVTTKFHIDRTKVTLPKTEIRSELPKGAAWVIIYGGDGEYGFKFSDGKKPSQPLPDLIALESEINAQVAVDPTKPFVIKADQDTPYQYIDQVWDVLRRAGVEEVILLTGQRTVEDMS